MELFQTVMTSVYNLFKMDFTIFGVTLCLFDVFIWSIVASLVLRFIWRIFIDGD